MIWFEAKKILSKGTIVDINESKIEQLRVLSLGKRFTAK